VERHDFKRKRDYALPVAQYLKKNKGIHPPGNSNADSGMGLDVLGLLHEFAGGGNAGFLSKVES
jgi:hypothetical protein